MVNIPNIKGLISCSSGLICHLITCLVPQLTYIGHTLLQLLVLLLQFTHFDVTSIHFRCLNIWRKSKKKAHGKPRVNSHTSQHHTYRLSARLLRHNRRRASTILPCLQSDEQILAHLHHRAELDPELVSLLCQGGAEDSPGGLAALLLHQGWVKPVDLLVFLVARLGLDAL